LDRFCRSHMMASAMAIVPRYIVLRKCWPKTHFQFFIHSCASINLGVSRVQADLVLKVRVIICLNGRLTHAGGCGPGRPLAARLSK
jgi:hypothetical protein